MADETWHDRMRRRAEELGWTAADLSRETDIKYENVAKYFQSKIENPRGDVLSRIARALGVTESWLRYGDVSYGSSSLPNAGGQTPTTPADFSLIPVYGQAMGGDDGYFILNGNKIADVLAPPSLRGVLGAYGVMVVGESMEPRYFAGETVFVNPRLPVRKGDFVVVQIRITEDGPPWGYIKRFVRKTADELVLEQYNPAGLMRFPLAQVESVHRIVMGGDG